MPPIEAIPDERCAGAPDRPYSAFCSVCWFPIYKFAMFRPEGCIEHSNCKDAQQCAMAQSWTRSTAEQIKAARHTQTGSPAL